MKIEQVMFELKKTHAMVVLDDPDGILDAFLLSHIAVPVNVRRIVHVKVSE